MRLGTFFLIPAALAAQSIFPWDKASTPAWEIAEPQIATPFAESPLPSNRTDRKVTVTEEGSLKITDRTGRILLRTGLPGRPLRLFRDAGVPLEPADSPFRFPSRTPLSIKGGLLPTDADDLRDRTQGLLWILDDGERFLTVVHPATLKVVHLPLPSGENWQLTFHPNRLEIREKEPAPDSNRDSACWAVSWVSLQPQFLELAAPPPAPKRGTAYRPFPD